MKRKQLLAAQLTTINLAFTFVVLSLSFKNISLLASRY